MMKRRQFLSSTVKGTLAATLLSNVGNAATIATGGSDKLGQILPTRPLGQTGERLTLLGVGGAHVGRMGDKDAEAFIEAALKEGVRFFDNAHGYSQGRAEELYGKYLCPKYRDDVFVMTKSTAKTANQFETEFNTSLKRLNTDYVDLMYIHSVRDVEDVDSREKEGVFDLVRAYQQQGRVRHIGFSCHTDIRAAIHFLDKMKQDNFICCCQTPINTVDAGDPHNSFTSQVLPRVVAMGHSHIAMKTLSGGALRGAQMNNRRNPPRIYPIPEVISLQDNFNFILSQPITSMVSGMESVAHLQENAGIVRNFPKLGTGDLVELVGRVASRKYYTDPMMEVYKTKA